MDRARSDRVGFGMSDPLRVLILDDVESDAILVERALTRAGLHFVARHVDHEAAFLRSLSEFRPDLVLSDYSLPGYDAPAALAAARRHDPDVPFIVVTGSLTEETAADCIKAGANDYVIKEHLARLPVAVRSALDRQRVVAERKEALLQAEREREELLARERRQRQTAETLAAANLALAQRHELQAILDTLLDYLDRLVPSASSMVLLVGAERRLEVAALRGGWTDPDAVRRVTFDTGANRLLREVLGSRAPIVVDDTKTDPRWEWVSLGAHVRSWLGVPLVIRGEAIGIYSLDRSEPGSFTEEDARLALSLAPAAATAVEMARLLRSVREAGEFNQQIIASAQDGIIVFDRQLRYQVWNRAMEALTGLAAGAVIGKTRSGLFVEPDAQGLRALLERALAGETTMSPDLQGTRPGGGLLWTSVRFAPLRDAAGEISGAIAIVRDITERKTVEAFRDEQNRILERITANAPLSETLHAIALLVEGSCPGVLCTIVLLDEDGIHIRHGAAPSLPEEFTRAVDGQGIGPTAGSCGTAIYRREVVEVEDILTDPLWADHRHLAALGRVLSCWSTPILSHEKRVLGSFAMYYREVRRPDPLHRRVVDIAASVAGIAIQRSRAEETLRRGAARLNAVIDGALDAVIGMDESGQVISWNPRAEAIFGWSALEAMGRKVSDLIIPPEYHEAHEAGLVRFLETRGSGLIGRRLELTALRRDRQAFPVELSLVALEEPGGTIFTAFIADISERKESARLLAESEERFRQIAENIREVFWMTDRARERVIYVSPAYEAIWGHSCASLYADPMSFADAIPAADREQVLRSVGRQASGEYDEIYRIVRPDGTLRWIHDRAFPVAGPGGEVVRVVGSAQDITELKRAEQALRDSEARYRTLFESAPDGILVSDADGLYVDVNPSGLRLLGYSREELLGLTLADLVAPSEVDAVVAALYEVWHGRAHHAEWRLRRKDGSLFDAEILGSLTADGRLLGLVRDVSERKRMEEQLRQSQKMDAVGRLAGGIAHDFNNILGVIIGYARRCCDARCRRSSRIAAASTRSCVRRSAAATLTRQLLAFSRKQVLAPKVLEPSAIVADVRKILEPPRGRTHRADGGHRAQGRVRSTRASSSRC